MNPNQSDVKRSSTFGIIALIVAVIAFQTPKFLLSLVLIALAAFIVIGFIKDGNKVFSWLALGIGAFLFYLMFQEESAAMETYSVTYQVTCLRCDVSYTNETGGTSNEKGQSYTWTKTVNMKGDQFISLSAQNNRFDSEVISKITVNDKELASETSSGQYAIASVNGLPKDILNK